LSQVPQDHVDVQRPFVGLIDDDRVVALQQPVAADLGQQDAVGHQFQPGAAGGLSREADLEADRPLPQLLAELGGDAAGDRAGGDPSGLGMADQPALGAVAHLQQHLGDLGGLAGAGLAGDHYHLVVTDGGLDVLAALRDGQIGGIADPRCGAEVGGAGGVHVTVQGTGPAHAVPRPGCRPGTGHSDQRRGGLVLRGQGGRGRSPATGSAPDCHLTVGAWVICTLGPSSDSGGAWVIRASGPSAAGVAAWVSCTFGPSSDSAGAWVIRACGASAGAGSGAAIASAGTAKASAASGASTATAALKGLRVVFSVLMFSFSPVSSSPLARPDPRIPSAATRHIGPSRRSMPY